MFKDSFYEAAYLFLRYKVSFFYILRINHIAFSGFILNNREEISFFAKNRIWCCLSVIGSYNHNI
jgi:hypothetical protein